MKRREFITLIGGAALFAPIGAHAQEAGRTYRLGVLTAQGRRYPVLYDELRLSGFVEGENLVVDARGFVNRGEQLPVLAMELVKANVDAIVCAGPAAARAAKEASRSIPILAIVDDMVAAGLVPSLARPGSNITGISIFATELDGKRQEILMDLLPDAHRMAALADSNSTATRKVQELQDAARTRGIELSVHVVGGPEGIVPAIEEAKRAGAEALNVLASPLLNALREDILARTMALRFPAIYQWPESAEEGGLIGYGPRLTQVYRQLARQLVKVLRGARPGDLPVEQPTRFELVINLKTAAAIGLAVPPALLSRADEVIE